MKSKSGLDVLWSYGHDDRVPCVVSPSASRADIEIGREDINEFTLAFVAPLSAENNGHYSEL